jgi:hypothetical protein
MGVQLPAAAGRPAGAQNVSIEQSGAQAEPNTGETTRL